MKTLLFLLLLASFIIAQLNDGGLRSALANNRLGWGNNCGAIALNLKIRANPARKRSQWTNFRAQFGKKFRNTTDEELHARIFEETEKVVAEHNAAYERGETTFTIGINQFADLTEDEWKARNHPFPLEHLEKLFEGAEVHNVTEHVRVKRHPANLDWRTWGGVAPVKNQGGCGSCYTFSAVAALETAHWRKYNTLPILSEQQLLDCTGEYGNGGCGGGWMHTAFKYLIEKSNGVALDRDYPYTATVGTCRKDVRPNTKVARYVRIPAGDEKALLDAVATTGTVAIAYNAGTTAHAYYKSGILDVPNCGNTPTHAVAVVGYGTENGVDFWTLKNSWGTGWGEKGFFRMRRGANMCGIADWGSYPFVA